MRAQLRYAIYDGSVGDQPIKKIYTGRNIDNQQEVVDGDSFGIVGPDVTDLTHYVVVDGVNPDVLTERVAFKDPDKTTVLADSKDKSTITDLPNPTNVRIRGDAEEKIQVTDGVLELTFDTPGNYNVILESFPYIKKEIEYVAT